MEDFILTLWSIFVTVEYDTHFNSGNRIAENKDQIIIKEWYNLARINAQLFLAIATTPGKVVLPPVWLSAVDYVSLKAEAFPTIAFRMATQWPQKVLSE